MFDWYTKNKLVYENILLVRTNMHVWVSGGKKF